MKELSLGECASAQDLNPLMSGGNKKSYVLKVACVADIKLFF